MAAEAEAEGGAGAKPKKGLNKLVIIGAAALLVVLAGGGVLFFMMSGSKPAVEEHAVVEEPEGFIFNLPNMIVNLNSEGGAETFLKLTIALEVANEEMMLQIQPRLAKVVDAFQVYLRELRRSDLEGSAGIYRLKEELLRRVNVAIAPAHVKSILFKEILVQ